MVGELSLRRSFAASRAPTHNSFEESDYAEDNLVWLKVRLPRGAGIRSITPQPSARFTQDGQEYVMWRRFYKQGEQFPLEIVYALD